MKNKRLLLIFLFCALLQSPLYAQTLKSAVDQVADYLTRTAVKLQPSHELVVSVVNYHSQKPDRTSKKIETELYFALERKFPDFKLILLEESLVGQSMKNAVKVKATYEQQGMNVTIRVQCISGLDGSLLAQTEALFTLDSTRRKTLVAVLDLEANMLNSEQRKAFSDMFRSAFVDLNEFDMASSAEIDKMDPDQIQSVSGCTRDSCATIIGEQLGVDRVISSSLRKIDEDYYAISAKMLDIKDGSIVASEAVTHNGELKTLETALIKLAGELTGGPSTTTASSAPGGQVGIILVKSHPNQATIMLNGKRLRKKTDAMLQNIPIGKHELVVYKGNLGAKKEIFLLPNKIEELELTLEPMKENVQIRSLPSASVYLDGRFLGKTPLINKIEVGTHQIEYRLDGYQTLSKTIRVQPFVTNSISERLEKLTQLSISSSPTGAEVYLDKKLLGQTPLTVSTTPGGHRLEVKYPDYHDYQMQIVAKPNIENPISVQLKPLIQLIISYSPPSASVKVDGQTVVWGASGIPLDKQQQTQSFSRKLEMGDHRIEISHPKAVKTIKDTVSIREGRSAPVKKEYRLTIDPAYIAKLEQDAENARLAAERKRIQEVYNNEMSSWRWKYRLSLLGGALAAGYAFSQNQAAVEASDQQKESEDAIQTAKTTAEVEKYKEEALNYNEQVKTCNQNTQLGTTASALFFGMAAWFWFSEPDKPEEISWDYHFSPQGDLRLSYHRYF